MSCDTVIVGRRAEKLCQSRVGTERNFPTKKGRPPRRPLTPYLVSNFKIAMAARSVKPAARPAEIDNFVYDDIILAVVGSEL